MMFSHLLCALLAPAITHAAAFQWSLPEATIIVPAVDRWSPAPTAAPQLSPFELFKRQTNASDDTCGFISGLSQSSLTCPPSSICATNTLLGVHGCCDPSALSACIIPTSCIASTETPSSCTDTLCTSDTGITRCTAAASPACYEWRFIYSKTTMTQHGCAASAFTSTAYRSWGPTSSTTPSSPTTTPTSTPTPTPSPLLASSKPSLGLIIGVTLGSCIFLSALALAIFLLYRKRRLQREEVAQATRLRTQYHSHGMAEYDPLGFSAGGETEADKPWQQRGAVHRRENDVPVYPWMGRERLGVVEVEGLERPVEAPG